MLIVIDVASVESYVKICSLKGVMSLLLISGITFNLILTVLSEIVTGVKLVNTIFPVV